MRTIFTAICVICLFGATYTLHAQDKLVLRNGRTVEVKVLRSSEEDDKVKYIYPSETIVYERPKSVIAYILYEDGRKEIFDDDEKESERVASRPPTSQQTPQRPATTPVTQAPVRKEVYWEDVKTTFSDADVKDMTRLKRISATSSISYKDAVQQLKKQAAALGATTILIMDVPDSGNTDDIEVVGVAFRDESKELSTPPSRPQSSQPITSSQPDRPDSSQPATSSAADRRRRTARLTDDYNNNTKLILDDAPSRQQTQRASARPTPQQQAPQERAPQPSEREIFGADEEDVVYLLNGRTIKGTIEEFEPDDFVSIRTSTGRMYEYTMDEVRRVTYGSASSNQSASAAQPASRRPNARDDGRVADNRAGSARAPRERAPRERAPKDNFYPGENDVRGYKGVFDVGYTLSFGNAEKGRFELSTSHGYQMNRNLFVGLGLGLHMFSARDPEMKLNMTTADKYPRYADPEEEIATAEGETLLPTSYEHGMDSSFMFVPAFIDVRAYLPVANSIVSPFASIKLGYTFNLSDGFGPAGFYFAPSIGAKFDISPSIGLFLNLGYTFQGLGESGTTKRVTETGGSSTTTLVRSEGYGYYYRDQVGGNLYKTTSAQGFSIRLGIEF